MRLYGTCALWGLLFLTALDSTESLQIVEKPKKGSNVIVSTSLPLAQCAVCTISGVDDSQTSCHSSLSLVPENDVKLLFNCSQPLEQSYTVTISSSVECTKSACSPQTIETQPSNLTQFPRTFIWEIKAPENILVSLTILGEGLAETSQPCSSGLQYLVTNSKTNRKDQKQYCQGGSLTNLDLLNQAVVSLEVKPNTQVAPVLFQASAQSGKTVEVSIDPGSTVVLNRAAGKPDCEVCIDGGSAPDCSSTEKTIKNAKNLLLKFSCLEPQNVFSVHMTTKIECTKNSCTPTAAEVNSELFKDFKKTKTWDISVPDRAVLSLDIPDYGLKSISTTESCQDGYQYTVRTTKSDKTIKTNRYCKDGTETQLELFGATTVTVEIPKGKELGPTVFNVKATPRVSRMMSVTSDSNTIILIQRVSKEPDCSVCVNQGAQQNCNPQFLRLENPSNSSIEFTCPHPQDVFNVEINSEIDCAVTSCREGSVQVEATFFPDFNRTFTWDLKVDATKTFQLDFPEPGMQQIHNEEVCPDDHTYSLVIYRRPRQATIGTFCRGGHVKTILVQYKGRVSLQVPGNTKLDPVDFKYNVGPATSMMAIVKVNLPRGVSDTDFFTPNYPENLPDRVQMQWDFTVPGQHNYTVLFRNYTKPECLNGNVEVEYQKEKTKVTKLSLVDPQPQHQQSDFSMVLKNCETNTTLQGLSLNYRVSLMRSGHPVLCTVDLTELQDVSIQIENVGSDPYCEISLNSEVKDTIKVVGGTKAKLSFLDCPNEDIQLTGRQVIECLNGKSCPSTSLTVPMLDSCLPVPLQNFTWDLSISEDSALDLVSPTGSLLQSLQGQECNANFSLHVAETNGFSIGDFCFNGMIQKIQVRKNVSVIATTQDLLKTGVPFLNVSFGSDIPATIIYRVNPMTTSPILLATPNWPNGMKSYSSVSWIVTLPNQYQAHVEFVNVSRPKCDNSHAVIQVKMFSDKEEIMSRREDEEIENLVVKKSFYLNMTNCKPEAARHFGILTKIVLQKKTNLLAILLGLAGVLVFSLIVLAVVCIVIKKKKRKLSKGSSLYMGKANIFRPNDQHFAKTRADNDSHVYDYIDDTMVYGHLLGNSSGTDSLQSFPKELPVDSYQTFTGPTGSTLPVINEPDPEPEMDQYRTFLDPSETFIPSRPRTPINRQDSLGFQDRRMVDNELYTFKNTGEINTIRLSRGDLEPEPDISEEYL